MTQVSLVQALTIFSWFLMAILLAFLLLIARFYRNMTKERTYFWAFTLPILFFGIGSARYAANDRIGGDLLGNVAWFVGGIVLIGLCVFLYRTMTAGR
jgi:hypothetical protein